MSRSNQRYRNVAEQLLNKYLFPDFLPDTGDQTDPRIPMMHTYTRQSLYNVVALLCQQSDETYGRIMELLDTTVPRGLTYHSILKFVGLII